MPAPYKRKITAMSADITRFDVRKDYFEILGVERNAHIDNIKTSYRDLAKKYHPDVATEGSSASNNSRFRAIQEAFDVLNDPVSRQKYENER